MDTLNIKKIRRLVKTVDVNQAASESGVSRRTLYRMRANDGKLPSGEVLQRLIEWAKGYK